MFDIKPLSYSTFRGTFSSSAFLIATTLLIIGCGVNLEEEQADKVMENIYKARKSGSFYKEFSFYAKDKFKIVPFDEVEATMRAVIPGAGRFKKAKKVSKKISRRNQLGEGLISYMVLSYEVTYSRMTLSESYYFLAKSEKPELVYMTMQF